MRAEALQAPAAVAAALAQDADLYAELAQLLQLRTPRTLLTLARGSSDHAARHFAYLVMARLGEVVTSLPMSLLTLQPSRLRCDGLAAFAFSQSGRSPDLVSSTRQLRAAGAATVAFVNEATSPLADAAQWTVPIRAGSETSVAATKSFIAQLAAGARLVSAWQGDAELLDALRALPQALTAAASSDWTAALPQLANAERLYVVGRGTGLAIAQEAALKFKETCGIQAEAFSSAELRHGPMALVGAGFPVLVLALRGPAQAGLLTLADELRARGAAVLLVAPSGTAGVDLPLETAPQADLDGITAVQSFYLMVEALARLRRYDPDAPAHLSKVTLTH